RDTDLNINKPLRYTDCAGSTDTFEEVKSKRSQKRKRAAADAEMQPEETVAAKRPQFPALSGDQLAGGEVEMRRVPVPAHRYSPLKENWMKIFTPIVEHLQLQVRFNLKTRNVEIKTCRETSDIGALTRAADFVKAFVLGFQVEVSVTEISSVQQSWEMCRVFIIKMIYLFILNMDSKFLICFLLYRKVHILGSFQNIKMARTAICNLILGSPPSKVYGNIRAVASRAAERF
uniref:Partner of NOB1 homolog n=1 Tax=Cyprinus carpio TaxID=7962 RepID=A0A8C2F0D7_CYPCA